MIAIGDTSLSHTLLATRIYLHIYLDMFIKIWKPTDWRLVSAVCVCVCAAGGDLACLWSILVVVDVAKYVGWLTGAKPKRCIVIIIIIMCIWVAKCVMTGKCQTKQQATERGGKGVGVAVAGRGSRVGMTNGFSRHFFRYILHTSVCRTR